MFRKERIAALLLCPLLMGQAPADDGRWYAGAYSYSDELGGVRIVAISGTGTRDDPFEITQEFETASAVTLVIRAVRPVRLFQGPSAEFATGMIHMRVVALNNSGLPWIGFEFELQEQKGQPSSFEDGLSFDQRRTDGVSISSTAFRKFSRDFEPYDQLLFTDGVIDPLESGAFEMFITDFTPAFTFYLKQDPQAPYS
jgi:hypothetical protein